MHHKTVLRWFESGVRDWGTCLLTEAGFMRLAMNPQVGKLSFEEANEQLESLQQLSGYRFWRIATQWTELVRPFRDRVYGHQQVMDACLLGLAVKENGVLVSLDRAVKHLARAEFS